MNPSEAKVFSSGIAGLLSSKKHSDVSYSRLNQLDDSVEFSNVVPFQKDHTSFCTKFCFGLLAMMLLIATVGSAIFIMNLKHFTVEVQLKEGNVLVYKVDQEMTVIGNEITTRNMSFVVNMYAINKTGSDCWFGIVLKFQKDGQNLPSSEDFAFLMRVTAAELGGFQDGNQMRFTIFGNRKTNNELSFYVHNILHQLLPSIKVKLYEFVLSKVSSSTRRTVVEKHGFLPGRVHLKRTMFTKSNIVTVMSKAGPDDFENFSSKNGESPLTSWKLTYDETSVVNKKTGMAKKSDMSLFGSLPLGEDFATGRGRSPNQGLAVRFRSIVKLIDESQARENAWKIAVKDESDISHSLLPPSAEQSSLMYFAPSKNKSDKKPSEELRDLVKLRGNSAGRSTKLPPMVKIVQHKIPKSDVKKLDSVDNDDDDDDDDDYANDEDTAEDSDDNDDDDDDDDDNDDDDGDGVQSDNEPSWPLPNFPPFGFGYEVRRRRSVETEQSQVIKKMKITKRLQPKNKAPDLDIVWDELMSSTPLPYREAPRVIQTSIMGLNVRAEIEYEVFVENDEDDDDNDDRNVDDDTGWDVTTAFRVTIGQYRITPFRRVHTLRKIRGRLPLKGQRKSSRWTVNAGDFVMCIPLFYIQHLCAATRLTFDVSVTYSLPRLSLSYPVEMTVNIGQTVTNNATVAGHASTWFQGSGFYTKGTVAVATLPVRLSFKEDTTPEWCVTGNLIQKMVRINSVPLSTWNCSLDYHKLVKKCVGLPAPSNSSLATFDLQYSAAEDTMFDNWHYPISCVHRKDLAPY